MRFDILISFKNCCFHLQFSKFVRIQKGNGSSKGCLSARSSGGSNIFSMVQILWKKVVHVEHDPHWCLGFLEWYVLYVIGLEVN